MKRTIFIMTLLITAILGLTAVAADAQSPLHKEWDRRIGGNHFEWAESIQPTADGGYIIGSSSASNPSGDKVTPCQGGFGDYWLVKINASGGKQWESNLGGSGNDYLEWVETTSDGGCILGGRSESGISGDKTQACKGQYDFWVVKTNSVGVKEWDVTLGTYDEDWLFKVHQTTDGGYILGGLTDIAVANGDKTQTGFGSNDIWIVKLSGAGVKQWDASFGGSHNDVLAEVLQTPDGGFLIGGYSQSDISGNKTSPIHNAGGSLPNRLDMWLIKTDANGIKQWEKCYGGDATDWMSCMQPTTDGGYLLAGNSNSGVSGDVTKLAHGHFDYWMLKINSTGVPQWDARAGSNGEDRLIAIDQTMDNGIVLAGVTAAGISLDKTVPSKGMKDYWMVKMNCAGRIEWDAAYGGRFDDDLTAIHQAPDGGFLLMGYSNSDSSGDKTQNNWGLSDIWLVKTNTCSPCVQAPKKPVIIVEGVSSLSNSGKYCPGDTLIAYTKSTNPTACSYAWTTPAGVTIVSGLGTNIITMVLGQSFDTAGNLTVFALNSCGVSQTATKTLIYGRKPAIPSAITGNTYGLCNVFGEPYYVENHAGLTYNWSFENNSAYLIYGFGTNYVEAQFPSNFVEDYIRVSATNGCGLTSSVRKMKVRAKPMKPVIYGADSVCPNQVSVAYNVYPAVPNATSYTWTAPQGSVIFDGAIISTGNTLTTTSVTVLVSFGNVSGSVKAKANGSCGSSATAKYPVLVDCGGSPRTANTTDPEMITLFPNPAKDKLNIMFNATSSTEATIQVFDMTGKIVLQKQRQANEGSNEAALDVSSLTPGVYQLLIKGEEMNYKERFVVE